MLKVDFLYSSILSRFTQGLLKVYWGWPSILFYSILFSSLIPSHSHPKDYSRLRLKVEGFTEGWLSLLFSSILFSQGLLLLKVEGSRFTQGWRLKIEDWFHLTLPYLTLPYLTLPYLTLPYLTFIRFKVYSYSRFTQGWRFKVDLLFYSLLFSSLPFPYPIPSQGLLKVRDWRLKIYWRLTFSSLLFSSLLFSSLLFYSLKVYSYSRLKVEGWRLKVQGSRFKVYSRLTEVDLLFYSILSRFTLTQGWRLKVEGWRLKVEGSRFTQGWLRLTFYSILFSQGLLLLKVEGWRLKVQGSRFKVQGLLKVDWGWPSILFYSLLFSSLI